MRALVLCLTDADADPRPRRLVQTLRDLGAAVEVTGPPAAGPRGVAQKLRTAVGMLAARALPVRGRVLAQRFDYASFEAEYGDETWDLVVVEDIYLLPLAFRLRARRVVMDAREYYPRIGESRWAFRALQRPELVWICRRFLPRCAGVLTVSDGLAAEYRKEFGVDATVIRSVPERQALPVNPPATDAVRMVHHGIANRNRQLEKLVAIARRLDARFTLDLYLTPNHGDPGYLAELRGLAALDARVRVLEPVPFEAIGATLNRYDVGLFYVEPTTFNLRHCLPNKLFEFIQARLAVAIGPSPDMAAVVREHGCGVVAEEFSLASMADALSALTPARILAFKQGSDRAAAVLNWATERARLEPVLTGLAP